MPTSSSDIRTTLRAQLDANAYPGYVYGYPHKKAYRALSTPVSLREAWMEEDRSALLCYVHLPFCHQRCSFCNLFTYVPADNPAPGYLDTLAREMDAYAGALGAFRFARLYLGGGTPTYLTTAELTRLMRLLRDTLGVDPAATHGCIEASPETVDAEKLAALREMGFERLSLGIQSLQEGELRSVNRRFDFEANRRALELIGNAGFPHFNVDLIYGLPGQTEQTWLDSLQQAIDSPATGLFLYPLYVRPMTGLDRQADALRCPTPHEMGHFYDLALPRLHASGFRQLTMRQFRRDRAVWNEGHTGDLEYRCQWHGTVGLGAGARSYTAGVHYSTPWKMIARNIRSVVDDYSRRMRARDFAIRYGFALDDDERRRRFTIQSLLSDGLAWGEFTSTFGVDAREMFGEELDGLREEELVNLSSERVRLTARGVRHADIVGQVFFSQRVRALVESFEYDL
jgi:oxygen-independent coproporphyrinogen III oxidase